MREQKQEGYVTVEAKVTRGDLTPEQFRGLAEIMRDYAGGYARTTVQQNFVLRWVREESVYDVWRALSELGLGDAGSREINDVVSCPGTDSCKLGITSSMGLNQAVQERIEALDITDELTRKLNVKISGCPNGCGQHHVGSIGFTGASIKVGEHTIPAYIPHVGGVFEGGEVKFGTRLKLRLPSKRVPDAIERWIGHYEANRKDGEEWNDFAERVGTAELEGLVKDLSMPVDFGLETMNTFIDWNRNVPFEVDSRRGRVRGIDQRTCLEQTPEAGRRSEHERQHERTAEPHSGAPIAARSGARPERTRCARPRAPRRAGRAAVLVPEGGVGAARRAAAPRRGHGSAGEDRDDRHRRAVPRDAADLARVRGALRREDRGAGRQQSRRAVERPRALLLGREGRGAGALAGRRRGLDHRHPPRAGPDAGGRRS